MGTLVIAALSSVIAATVVSRLWQAGTVMATAMTPVIVTLVKEALERPAQRVSSIATRTATPSVARTARAIVPPPPEAEAPPPPMVADPELTRMRVYGAERRTGRRWKLAIATGLLGFAICVGVMTLPELVAGRSVVSGQHDTTIFGGQRHVSATKTKTTTDEKTTTDTRPKDQTTSTEQTDTTTTTTTPTQPTETAPQAAPTQPVQPAPQTQTTPPPQTQTAPPAQTQPPPATP
jgi:outer membrane biosynthesis protein TonB